MVSDRVVYFVPYTLQCQLLVSFATFTKEHRSSVACPPSSITYNLVCSYMQPDRNTSYQATCIRFASLPAVAALIWASYFYLDTRFQRASWPLKHLSFFQTCLIWANKLLKQQARTEIQWIDNLTTYPLDLHFFKCFFFFFFFLIQMFTHFFSLTEEAIYVEIYVGTSSGIPSETFFGIHRNFIQTASN